MTVTSLQILRNTSGMVHSLSTTKATQFVGVDAHSPESVEFAKDFSALPATLLSLDVAIILEATIKNTGVIGVVDTFLLVMRNGRGKTYYMYEGTSNTPDPRMGDGTFIVSISVVVAGKGYVLTMPPVPLNSRPGYQVPSPSFFTECIFSTWTDEGFPCIVNNSKYAQGYALNKLDKIVFFTFSTNWIEKKNYRNTLNIGDGARVVVPASAS